MYAFDGQTCKGDSMATNREPLVTSKPWPKVVEEELDRVRDELEKIAGHLAQEGLTPVDWLELENRRQELERDFIYLCGELKRAVQQPPACHGQAPAIVVVADPLDDDRLMRRRAAMVDQLRVAVERTAPPSTISPPVQLALAL